ncbi:LpqB family beta-propeller domain-containing protein [Streptomyces sp. NPDC048717]|uniref:LpqB family beta-propeller domain-containing protein n=1 Tax=Streptomyces sp. NPDC048717 TaxID=3154928 RepID=UPI00343BB731
MPDSGDVQAVRASNAGDSQVRVYAVAPRDNADPEEIVDGFLEAMTSDDPGFATARKYLTKRAARSWKPEQSITVLTNAPHRGQADRPGDPDTQGRTFPLSGRRVAQVDARHAYRPEVPSAFDTGIHVVQQPASDGKSKEWRIDSLPPGLVLGEADFLRNYRAVNKYYFASDENWVVADPVYIRQRQDPVTRMDPVTQTVKALLEGPTKWLGPAVESRFPSGTELAKDVYSLTPDDQSTLKIPLNDKADRVSTVVCKGMAAQLLFTLGDLTSVRVEQVEIQGSTGALCLLGKGQAEQEFSPVRDSGRGESPYFVDEHQRLMTLADGGRQAQKPTEVPGPFGKGTVRLGPVAVDRAENRAAAVLQDGRELRVGSLTADDELPDPVVTSTGARPEDRLSAPSWDGRGDLWVADRDPLKPRLWMVPGGQGERVAVGTPWLRGGARIESLRVSADGVRIALLVTRDDHTTLQIGRVGRSVVDGREEVTVTDLQDAAPRLESVTAVSWAGPSRLVVVGTEAGGVQQVRYVQTDGSTSATSVLPGLNGVTSVAAPYADQSAPVVADSRDDGIARLAPGTNWQPLRTQGSLPVYPG